jgi:hypothetical protein
MVRERERERERNACIKELQVKPDERAKMMIKTGQNEHNVLLFLRKREGKSVT